MEVTKTTTSRNGSDLKSNIQELLSSTHTTFAANHQKCQIIFCPTHQQQIASCQAGSCSCWSMAKVVSQNFCQSSFPPLKNNSESSSTSPSSKVNLFASVFVSNSNLDDQGFQPHQFPPSKFTMSPIKFST